MRDLIDQIRTGEELSPTQVGTAVEFLADEGADENEKAEFLKALREKGETAGEIAAFVRELLKRAVDPGFEPSDLSSPLIDVCGTGGDRMDLFNVSTAAMFPVAAAGAIVVKHGNRGITSKCGGADVLEGLGVRIDLPPDRLRESLEETGLGFIFAPAWHPAFKAIVPVRKRLAAEGVPTIFNLLGPLLNPAQPPFQLVGVFSATLLPKFAQTLKLLGRTRAWAVHGLAPEDRGVDELSTMGLSYVAEVDRGEIRKFEIEASSLGLAHTSPEALRGGDREENAEIVRGILAGVIRDARRDVVVLNAAAALVIAGLAADLPGGIARAGDLIDSGAALAKLDALREFTNR